MIRQRQEVDMKTNKEKWIFTAILAVIEIFLTAAELGFFTIGKIAFTILHIPVFIAVIEIGLLPYGSYIERCAIWRMTTPSRRQEPR